jgi:hypothetical protein
MASLFKKIVFTNSVIEKANSIQFKFYKIIKWSKAKIPPTPKGIEGIFLNC